MLLGSCRSPGIDRAFAATVAATGTYRVWIRSRSRRSRAAAQAWGRTRRRSAEGAMAKQSSILGVVAGLLGLLIVGGPPAGAEEPPAALPPLPPIELRP